MESRVLLPSELILTVRPSKDCSIARFLEHGVGVVTREELPKGHILSPSAGTVRCGRLDVYSTLPAEDMRRSCGAFDEVSEGIAGNRFRKCNWVRFLSVQDESGKPHNVRSFFDNYGQRLFELTERVYPNTELILSRLEDFQSINKQDPSLIEGILSDSALDLSLPLLQYNFHPPEDSSTSEDRKSVASDSGISSSEEYDPSGSPRSSRAPIKKTTTKKMLPCDFCGKCFDRPSLLNRHLRTHTGERPHVCDVCEKGFSTSSSLNTHRRIHSGEKPHECGTCGKRFTASSNLYYHRMTHVKEKPHKCELCQKSFPTPGDLKSHKYIHNGSWPHRCHICDRGFSKITNLKNHLFLHTGEKPHECPVCGKRFALGCNMKAHLKTHHHLSKS